MSTCKVKPSTWRMKRISPQISIGWGRLAGMLRGHINGSGRIFNIPNWARHLPPAARELGLNIACDIQDVVDPADPYCQDFIRYADYLFFSAANHPDPRPVMKYYLSINPEVVILATLGANGCAIAATSGIKHFPAVQLDLPVVDTNGAGDAFAAGFLFSRVLEGRELEDAVRRGQICARHKCAQQSSSADMITCELLNHYDH
jgi:sugar/nucleoside kinase (ribokinase family)